MGCRLGEEVEWNWSVGARRVRGWGVGVQGVQGWGSRCGAGFGELDFDRGGGARGPPKTGLTASFFNKIR